MRQIGFHAELHYCVAKKQVRRSPNIGDGGLKYEITTKMIANLCPDITIGSCQDANTRVVVHSVLIDMLYLPEGILFDPQRDSRRSRVTSLFHWC